MKPPDGMKITLGRNMRSYVEATVEVEEVTHRCPPAGSGTFPCCKRTPFEVPLWHRMTVEDVLVTCTRTQSDSPGGVRE